MARLWITPVMIKADVRASRPTDADTFSQTFSFLTFSHNKNKNFFSPHFPRLIKEFQAATKNTKQPVFRGRDTANIFFLPIGTNAPSSAPRCAPSVATATKPTGRGKLEVFLCECDTGFSVSEICRRVASTRRFKSRTRNRHESRVFRWVLVSSQ